MTPPLLCITKGHQNLRHRDTVLREGFLIRVCELDLTAGRCGLLSRRIDFCMSPRCRRPTAIAPDDTTKNLGAGGAQLINVVSKRIQPVPPNGAAFLIDKKS